MVFVIFSEKDTLVFQDLEAACVRIIQFVKQVLGGNQEVSSVHWGDTVELDIWGVLVLFDEKERNLGDI